MLLDPAFISSLAVHCLIGRGMSNDAGKKVIRCAPALASPGRKGHSWHKCRDISVSKRVKPALSQGRDSSHYIFGQHCGILLAGRLTMAAMWV